MARVHLDKGIVGFIRRSINNMFTELYNSVDTINMSIDEILEEVVEIEKHLHGNERWYGVAVTPSGTHFADPIDEYTNANVVAPFTTTAANDNWGLWTQVLGSDDTPFDDTMTKFDFHKIGIVDSSATNVHCFIQIAHGVSGAQALTDKTYTTIQYLTPTNQAAEGAVEFMSKRYSAGSLTWVRCLAIGANATQLDFYIGLHEYAQ